MCCTLRGRCSCCGAAGNKYRINPLMAPPGRWKKQRNWKPVFVSVTEKPTDCICVCVFSTFTSLFECLNIYSNNKMTMAMRTQFITHCLFSRPFVMGNICEGCSLKELKENAERHRRRVFQQQCSWSVEHQVARNTPTNEC